MPVTVRIANDNVYHKTIYGDLVLEGQEVDIVEFATKGVVEGEKKASCEGYDEATGTGGTKGEGSFACQLCKETITVVTVRTHTWDEGKVTTPVTCTTNGETTYTCSFCKDTKTKEIKAEGHTWVIDEAKTVNATWDTAGTLALKCSNGDCKATTSADIPAINEAKVIDSKDEATSGYTVWCEIVENCGRSGKYVVTLFAEADKGIVDENSQPVKQKDIKYSFVASKPATDDHDFVTPLYAVYREDQDLTYVGRFCDKCMQFVVEDGYIFVGKGEWNSATNQCLGADGKPLAVWNGIREQVLTAEELAALNAGYTTEAAAGYHWTLTKGMSLSMTVKVSAETQAKDWTGIVTRVFTNKQADASLFFQGNNYLLNGIKSGFTASADVVNNVDNFIANSDGSKVGYTLTATASLSDDGKTLTVSYSWWNAAADVSGAATFTATKTFTVNADVTEMVVYMGVDAVTAESATINIRA